MKILLILLNPEIRTGGHRRYLELASGLADRGNEVVLIKNPRLSASGQEGVRCIDLEYGYKKRIFPYSFFGALKILFARHRLRSEVGRCDYVVIFGETHLFAGILLKHILKAALLFAFRSNAVEESRISLRENAGNVRKRITLLVSLVKYKLYERLAAAFSNLIVFQSERDRESFLSRVPAARGITRVVPGNIGEPWYAKEWENTNRGAEPGRVIFLGALNERKGIRHLIEAFRLLRAETPVSLPELRIYGTGVLEKELKSTVRSAGLEDKIRFFGKTSKPFEAIAAADLVVVPSLYDSYPNVVLEALHTGTPVIASRAGGIPDILCHDELLFEPADPRAIADKIRALLDDPAAYARVRGLCAGRLDRFRFDWPEAWERIMTE